MGQFFGCDAHKKYSLFTSIDDNGHRGPFLRIEHNRNQFRCFLKMLPPGSPIAIESVGNWYWIIDEIEKAGHKPRLAHAAKAKLMMGQINKTDKLDAHGLAILLRNSTLPSVWIPPGELRDQRELTRMRMALVRVRTMLKNRIHATLAKYAISIEEVSDIFGVRGRSLLREHIVGLPPQTRRSIESQLELLEDVERHIKLSERQIEEVIKKTPEMKLLMSVPGVGPILAAVIVLEIGDIGRFASAERLASYAGTVPRVRSSGGKTFYWRARPDVNHYLRWAFIEAANVCVLQKARMSGRHIINLYTRIMRRRGHGKAVVAVARHLAEATYWILKKCEPYREPGGIKPASSTQR